MFRKVGKTAFFHAIQTEYFELTKHRPSRVKATAVGGSVTVLYNHDLDSYNNHHAAALALADKYGWDRDWVGAALPRSGYAFVCIG